MTPESPRIPDWAQRERLADMAWINENLHVFLPAALAGYARAGRGAIVVDTTQQPVEGEGNPLAYMPKAIIERLSDLDLIRMVRQYDPHCEFVVEVLKAGRDSKYRIHVPQLRR
jgi:hypothetical protein